MSASKIHPAWWAVGAGVLVLALAAGTTAWQMARAPQAAAGQPAGAGAAADDSAGTPWAVTVAPDASGEPRSQVFGLSPGQTTLAEVAERFGDTFAVGLVARYRELGALEGFVDPMNAGFVAGKLVIGFDAPDARLAAWRANSPGQEILGSGARRIRLAAADWAEAGTMRIGSLGFIPSLRLSEADVRARFGEPADHRNLADGVVALRYPKLGLLVLVRPGSRPLLQYVAPVSFDERTAPVLAAAASAPE